jgi:hypothetical protein
MPELSGFSPDVRARTRTEGLAALVERQFGVVHRTQLERLGVSGTTVSRWLADHRLVRLYPGVFAFGHAVLRDEGRMQAALLHAGPGSALSHLTGAWWWGLVEDEPPVIHVSAPGDVASVRGLAVHHPRRLEVIRHRGLRVTPVAETILGAAGQVKFGALRRMLAEAEFQRLATLGEMERVLGRGRPGSAALRRAVLLHQPKLALTRSVLEERFLSLCERYEIPLPELNVYVCGLLVDALWRSERVVVELDGHRAHGLPSRMERDRERDLTLRRAGFAVLRYTWAQVTRRPAAVAGDLNRELSAFAPARRA